ncbi:head scaffolding protein [Bacillus phage DLc1]|uniref:Scaffold protein n=1 Tax=Bacillus phage DLc1 TaxID=2777318 RepID=A0A7M1RQT6_9CAUD|nr:head scaffolding protein [Bacillus phage DLc1]QOR56281.1 scaffold protein [Bacillus phage DLc1]
MKLTREQHAELMQELLKGNVDEKRSTEIVDALADDRASFDDVVAKTTKLNEDLMLSNTKLRDSNAHWFNKVTSQSQLTEQQQKEQKEEAKKNQTLSDVLGGM